jgi:predicted NBD/HSP70 family sugar kinase
MSESLWGIDLGGTKIECVVLDKQSLEIKERQRIPTLGNEGYETVLQQIKKLVDQVSTKIGTRPERIGIGTPGSINPYTQQLRNCNSVYLNGQTFQKDVQQLLDVQVITSNDANCFALSEYNLGVIPEAYADAKVVFGVIMGTGVGGGLVVNGQIIHGANGIGGEWGHNYLDVSGGDCYCGKIGCVERVISGPALESYYASLSGSQKSLKDIVALYRASDDQHAHETMERLYLNFGKAISCIINIVDPDVIVIGGGVGNIDELYTKGVESAKKFIFSDYVNTQFIKPKYGDSSGVLGAAFL